jgi:uncharacterized protein YjbI with pentapeptide repeats
MFKNRSSKDKKDDKKFIRDLFDIFISETGKSEEHKNYLERIKIAVTVIGFMATIASIYISNENSRKDRELNNNRLSNENTSRALEQLTSKEIFIRMSGIYLLNSALENSQAKNALLSSFIIKNRPRKSGIYDAFGTSSDKHSCEEYKRSHKINIAIEPDIQAAIKLIGDSKEIPVKINLEKVDLSGLKISDTNFSNIILKGSDLHNSIFENLTATKGDFSFTDMIETKFIGEVNLKGSDFRNAMLCEVDFLQTTESKVDLSKTDMTDADLSGSKFSGADLSGAILIGANLSDTNLSMVRNLVLAQVISACNWERATYSSNLEQELKPYRAKQKSAEPKPDCFDSQVRKK